jgi:hypothetical protein
LRELDPFASGCGRVGAEACGRPAIIPADGASQDRGWRMSGSRGGALAIATLAGVLGAASVARANVIYDGSFGHGLSGWRTKVLARGIDPGYPHLAVLRTPPKSILRCNSAQRHHPYLQMDVPAGASAYIEQSIIVPVGPGRLKFRTWGDLEPVKVTVSIVDGTSARPLLSYRPPLLRASPTTCSGRKPITESLKMGRYAGQAVSLRVQATSAGLTGAIVDLTGFEL